MTTSATTTPPVTPETHQFLLPYPSHRLYPQRQAQPSPLQLGQERQSFDKLPCLQDARPYTRICKEAK